ARREPRARRLARWLTEGSGPESEIVASEPVVGGRASQDGPLVPGWQIAVTWLTDAARWTRRAARGTLAWTARRRRTRRGRALLAGILALLVAIPTGLGIGLSALLRDDGGGSGPNGNRGPYVLRIGVMAPLSGDLGNIGVAVRNAVTLAVDEVNESKAIPGWKVEVVAKDDLSRPDGGSAAAEAFAKDQAIIGVVGPLSSTVARVTLPVLDAAGIPVVSPSNSEPELTAQDQPEADRQRPYDRYFRLTGSDASQAIVGANYAVHDLNWNRIVVVDGGPSYGRTLAERFAGAAVAAGGSIVGSYRVDGDGADDAEVELVGDAIRWLAPDLVYTTTGYAFASALRQRMAADGLSIPLLGTDAMVSARYLDSAGEEAEGDLATDLAVPLSRLPAAGGFAAAFLDRWGPVSGGPEQPASPDKKPEPSTSPSTEPAGSGGDDGPSASPDDGAPASGEGPDGSTGAAGAGTSAGTGDGTGEGGTGEGGDEEPSPQDEQADMIPAVAAYAYDAARALLRAAAAVLPGRVAIDDATRGAVAAEIGGGSFAGVTGQISFDAFGDRRDPAAVVYAVLNGRFVPFTVQGD
ncbi:branched-chain amino acid ABC transporter substrate-binding protein, partial [Frankia nepalensis]